MQAEPAEGLRSLAQYNTLNTEESQPIPMPTHSDFIKHLQPWPAFARAYWYDDPRRPEIGCFGTGYNSWGVQTNQKFLGAMAVLGADPDFDAEAVGMSREEVLDLALRALRFSIASHISGDLTCTDGTNWGHTWISLLGVERMMHGVEAIRDHLTDEDRDGLRRMLISEADAALEQPVRGTKWAADGGNRPESNIWNGAYLWRAAQMYPDAPHVADWIEKAHRFMVNGISVVADAADDRLVAGRPVSSWHVGPNYFANYALDHHGYLNVGYMVICLSNIAMLHFACKSAGWEAPESLYHHSRELWNLVKRLIFADGRLMRIGGDTRQRYCYCQDYLLPALLWATDYLEDPHAAQLEQNALGLIDHEQRHNADGSFLWQRLETIRTTNPYYYTRLESDKAVVLSMNGYWRRILEIPTIEPDAPFDDAVVGAWAEPEHGAILHRSKRRAASWSWRASEAPQGLCLPPDDGHLAEWCANMGGCVRLMGETGKRMVHSHDEAPFPGGFLTTGTMYDAQKAYFGEGWTSPEQALHHYAVAALPDDRTMVVMEFCRLGIRSYLSEIKGLKLNVANDLFNGSTRTYTCEDASITADAAGGQVTGLNSPWACVDDRIGVVGIYGAESLTLYQAGRRRASGYGDSLYYDELCFPCTVGTMDVSGGAIVLDCCSAVLSGADADETRAASVEARRIEADAELVRAVGIQGADGIAYMLVANFDDARAEVTLPCAAESVTDVVSTAVLETANATVELELPPFAARLLRI